MLRLSLLGKDLETRLLASSGEERVTTPPCGIASVLSGHTSPSSGNTSSLSRSKPPLDRQCCEARGLPCQQPPDSHSQQRQQHQHQQQRGPLGSAFAPYVRQLGLLGPSTTAAAGASLVQPRDGGSCPDPATIDKLAQLLLGRPQASNQLTAMVAALKAGQTVAEPNPLTALESCGSDLPGKSRKRPLDAARSIGCPQPLPQREPSSTSSSNSDAGRPLHQAPMGCVFTADTLQRLARLLVEVPSLSDSLEKALWGGLEAQQQQQWGQQPREEQPGAKRPQLSSSPAAVVAAADAASTAPPMPLQATADSRLGIALDTPTPPAGEPLGAPASIKPPRSLPVSRTAVPLAAGPLEPATLAAAPPRQPGRLRAAQQLLPRSTGAAAAHTFQPAAYQQQQQQQHTAPVQPFHAATTVRAAGAQSEGLAGASMDETKQALLVWRYLKARKQKREAETALLRYCGK